MLAYRAYKKGFLRDYLEKNIKASIAEGMQEKILDLLAESFDYSYFDESEYECNDVINLRFDVRNEALYAELFVRLDNIGIKRSAYLRNLINEYFKQSEYQKERICFNQEYSALDEAITNELIVQFQNEEKIVRAFPIALEYSVKYDHWYILYFEENRYEFLYSVPIYKLHNILLLHQIENAPNVDLCIQVNSLIESEEFDTNEVFFMGENNA